MDASLNKKKFNQSLVRQKERRKVTRKIILGVPLDLTDAEITDQIAINSPLLEAKRVYKKRDGAPVQTSAVTLDFETNSIPSRVYIAFKVFKVRDYIPPPVRCYKCLQFGHKSIKCTKKQKCSICSMVSITMAHFYMGKIVLGNTSLHTL